LSTREIAAELFLSSKTIANYVARIYMKLGISSRKELPARLKALGADDDDTFTFRRVMGFPSTLPGSHETRNEDDAPER